MPKIRLPICIAVAVLGALLAPSAAVAQGVPAVPADVVAVPGDGQVTLSWTAGSDNGGTVIRWEYMQSTPATGVWVPIPNSSRATNRHTVVGLANGGPARDGLSGYRFRVRAVSGAGNGVQSAESVVSDTVTGAIPSTVPAAPADLQVEVGNSHAVLRWAAATANTAADGFSPIISYQYRQKTGPAQYAPWTLVVGSGAATERHTILGLANGTSYQFQVRALNANGVGAVGETAAATVGTVPGRPRTLSAVPGDKMVTLFWTPSSNGGFPVTSWQLRVKEFGDGADPPDFADSDGWVAIPGSGPNTAAYALLSLENASKYKFQVRAVNARGTGSAAESAVADPGSAPGAPTALSGAATHDSVTLTWAPPVTGADPIAVDDGGSPVTRYEYAVRTGFGGYGEWTAIAGDALFQAPEPPPPDQPVAVTDVSTHTGRVAHVVEDLTGGTPYWFRVRAVNAITASDYVEFQDDRPVYLGTRPPSPAEFSARALYDVSTGTARVRLTWVSGGDGDSPITQWQYRQTDPPREATEDWPAWVDICNSHFNFDDPAPPPQCRSTTASVTLPRPPPTPGGINGPDRGLAFEAGVNYSFVIRAVNAHGNGLQSTTATAEFPEREPSAPPAVYIGGANGTVEGGTITLNWLASFDGGSPVTHYEYAVWTGTGRWSDRDSDINWIHLPVEVAEEAVPGVTSYTYGYGVPSTAAGAVHTFRIRAVNEVEGEELAGDFAQSPAVVPGAPGTPGAADLTTEGAPSLNAGPGNSQTTLSLTGTTGNTGPATQWQYSYRIRTGLYSEWTYSNTGARFDPSAINPLDGLRNGVPYTFRIRAVNPVGLAGPPLVSSATRPGVAPPAPLGLTATPGDQEITLRWTSQGSGGPPIIRWEVCWDQTPAQGEPLDCNGDDDWDNIRYSNSRTTSHTIDTLHGTFDPLSNGTSYTFQVRARNNIGGGAPAQTYPVVPGRPPEAPSRVLVTPAKNRVTITVGAPQPDDGRPVVGYQVRKRRNDGPYDAWTALGTTAEPQQPPSAQTGVAVTGLINGASYTFQVRAVNGFGPGAEIESAAVTPVGPPEVGLLSAEPGNAQAVLTWTLAGNGGSPITKWQYRLSESGRGYRAWTDIANSGPATTSHTVTGLDNGVEYSFQVRAANHQGTSAPTNPALTTPLSPDPPDPPAP